MKMELFEFVGHVGGWIAALAVTIGIVRFVWNHI
jgi:hypothetical protein